MLGRPRTFEHCTIRDCSKRHWALGLCRAHYQRRRRHGDPLGSGTGKHKHRETKAFLEAATIFTNDACLPWPYCTNKTGYGLINIDGRSRLVSRIVCDLAHGQAPVGKTDAAHSCGNPICVNPQHLRWATRKENSDDKLKHGTIQRGSDNAGTKLTEANVRAILAQPGRSKADLAAEFGVGSTTIHRIRHGENWGWLDAVRESK